jgi:hypothetical protein
LVILQYVGLLICTATNVKFSTGWIKEALVTFASTRRSLEVPRYYFHVRRGQMTVVDQEGIELANNVEAVQEAERRGRQIATEEAGAIIVEDEWDHRVVELPLDID